MSVVAIITARGGSKRIPKKNIKNFCGKPIIAYSIEVAINSGIFDRVIVSTDDIDIKVIAESYGAEVPFFRSTENSNDTASLVDVTREVLTKVKDIEYFCCILPTSPLIKEEFLLNTFHVFIKEKLGLDFCVPVVEYDYPIQRALIIENDLLEFREDAYIYSRSQDLEKTYHDVGQFYWGNRDSIFKYDSMLKGKVYPFIIPAIYVQDIDNIEDWEVAEFKYKFLKSKDRYEL